MFNVGLLFLMTSISKIDHSSFPRHFWRTLKFVFFQEMLANNGMFVFLYALMDVTSRVTDIICITQITFKFINNILLVH